MNDDIRLIEYRVKPVTRYIVTKYEERGGDGNHSTSDDPRIAENRVGTAKICGRGEFDNAETAYEIGYALAKADHERMGWPLDDPRIRYPQIEDASAIPPVARSQP